MNKEVRNFKKSIKKIIKALSSLNEISDEVIDINYYKGGEFKKIQVASDYITYFDNLTRVKLDNGFDQLYTIIDGIKIFAVVNKSCEKWISHTLKGVIFLEGISKIIIGYFLAGFLIGFLFGVFFCGCLAIRAIDNKIKGKINEY